MTATPEERDAFIATFLDALPTAMRPSGITRTINKHLADCYHNGWQPKHLAQEVAAGVGNASNPAGMAVYRLGVIAKVKPQVTPTPPVFAPQTRAPQLPLELKTERSLIMRRILNGELDADAGADLIAKIYTRFALMQEPDLG